MTLAGPYGVVHRDWLRAAAARGVSAEARLVGVAIGTWADAETGSAWPSMATLAAVLGVQRHAILRRVDELRRAGLLRAERPSRRAPLHYTLTMPTPEPSSGAGAPTPSGGAGATTDAPSSGAQDIRVVARRSASSGAQDIRVVAHAPHNQTKITPEIRPENSSRAPDPAPTPAAAADAAGGAEQTHQTADLVPGADPADLRALRGWWGDATLAELIAGHQPTAARIAEIVAASRRKRNPGGHARRMLAEGWTPRPTAAERLARIDAAQRRDHAAPRHPAPAADVPPEMLLARAEALRRREAPSSLGELRARAGCADWDALTHDEQIALDARIYAERAGAPTPNGHHRQAVTT